MSLQVTKVISGYGKSIIVSDMSIYTQPKEIVIIIGPNGSGKSTLMKTILGYIKPFSGNILFNNKKIVGLKPNAIAKQRIGYVPQLNNVFQSMTIKENLEMGAYLSSEDQYSIEELLEIFPALKGREKSRARTLSGGERQMLALARAIINKPILLCLDEPTAALAPNLVKDIFNKLLEIRDLGTTIILIEQNAKQSLSIGDRGYVLATGKKVEEGPAQDLLNSPKIQKHYLGIKTL